MENTPAGRKRLVAVKEFTDKQGVSHKKDETFDCQNEQEAQEYIRAGNAREAGQTQQK